VYPIKQKLPDTFFLRGADCWGWATWKKGWKYFEPDGKKLLNELEQRGLTHEFDFEDSYPFTQMLRDQIKGKNNSWAIRWNASAFLAGKLTLYPSNSYVQNIGNDDSGTHSKSWSKAAYDTDIQKIKSDLQHIPVQESREARKAFTSYFRENKLPLVMKVLRKIKTILGK
jgi:hypothetical protein